MSCVACGGEGKYRCSAAVAPAGHCGLRFCSVACGKAHRAQDHSAEQPQPADGTPPAEHAKAEPESAGVEPPAAGAGADSLGQTTTNSTQVVVELLGNGDLKSSALRTVNPPLYESLRSERLRGVITAIVGNAQDSDDTSAQLGRLQRRMEHDSDFDAFVQELIGTLRPES